MPKRMGNVFFFRYRKKDGSVIWAKTNINSVRDNYGKVKYQVALVEDITSDREKTLIIDMVNNLTKSILGVTDIHQIAWEIVNKIANYLDSNDCVIVHLMFYLLLLAKCCSCW